MMRFEKRTEHLLPFDAFLVRVARFAVVATVVMAGSLGVGMAGYHFLERLSWVDAFLNASMILSGMGPVAELHTEAGKLFAGAYALFSGVVFLVVVGLLLAPALHRILHKFHIGTDSTDQN